MHYFFDCETTSLLHNGACEIIEGFFLLCDSNNNVVDEYLFQARPEKWEVDSEHVHRISFDQSASHPEKSESLLKLLIWLDCSLPIYIYVNENNELGNILFDKAAIQLLFFDCYLDGKVNYYDFYKFANNFVSVLPMVRNYFKANKIDPPKNAHTKRVTYKQTAVFEYLFNKNYNAHNAKDDVYALRDIYGQITGTEFSVTNSRNTFGTTHNQQMLSFNL